jgi:hypothetical protein
MSINTQPDASGYALTPFTVPFNWEIVKEYRDGEGYVDSKKIEVGFFDSDDDGVVDDPEIFDKFITTNASKKYIFLKKYITTDNVDDFRYVDQTTENIQVVDNEAEITDNGIGSYPDNSVFYQIDKNIFKVYNVTTEKLELSVDYRAYSGRDKIIFQYEHAADESSRIDPSSSNIIDVYMLTKQYDTLYRQYLQGAIDTRPLAPSSDTLYVNFGEEINKIKSISDEVIYHPVKYKVLFGTEASDDLKAMFKIVKNPDRVVNENELKANVIAAINEFFAIENWEFGDTFYFSELSNYVMTQLAPDLAAFVIVPIQESLSFGSMFEVRSEADEVFISSATVENIEVVSSLTASKLKATGAIYADATQASGVVSASGSNVSSNISSSSSSSGGLSY